MDLFGICYPSCSKPSTSRQYSPSQASFAISSNLRLDLQWFGCSTDPCHNIWSASHMASHPWIPQAPAHPFGWPFLLDEEHYTSYDSLPIPSSFPCSQVPSLAMSYLFSYSTACVYFPKIPTSSVMSPVSGFPFTWFMIRFRLGFLIYLFSLILSKLGRSPPCTYVG